MPNLHPILVHFPIALLTCYALFEIFLARKDSWKRVIEPAKFAFLFLGTIGSWMAFITGDLASEAFQETSLIETHEFFAGLTVWIFTVIAGAYFIQLLVPMLNQRLSSTSPLRAFLKLETVIKMILTPSLVIFGALIGLIAVTITGALGGALVYGPEIDPIVSFVVRVLVR